MLPKNILLTGRAQLPPEPIPLRAGPLRLLFDQGDLRAICLGEFEILRRVYVAVRDRNWGTTPAQLSNLTLRIEENAFSIDYDVENQQGEIDFAWHGRLSGTPEGRIVFSMDGIARTTFLKNRIGFCVLFPASDAGQPVTIHHEDGTCEQTEFPVDISADQPVRPFERIQAITLPLGLAGEAVIRFAGDVFEMEDQRLWTDASYKVFCTPLALPYPAEIQAGTRVSQSVELVLTPAAARVTVDPPSGAQVVQLRLPPDTAWRSVPLLGLGTASHGQPLSVGEVDRLKALHLHHLRVDLLLADPDYVQCLARAAGEAEALGIGLEIALRITAEQAENELSRLRGHLDQLRLPVCGWLIYPAQELYAGGSPTERVLRVARQHLEDYYPGTPFAAGTNTDYIFLKRTPPPVRLMDQVCITLNPQVHAFDDLSLMETLEAQPMVVESARQLADGLPVIVSPITLKPRFNAYATGPALQIPPGALPPQVDPRQLSLFGASWTLGSLRAMVASGAGSVTYYETTGWLGVMERAEGSPLPQAFPSQPGTVFPLYHVLADFGEFAGGQAAPLTSSAPLLVSGIMLREEKRMALLIANHTAQPQAISLPELDIRWQSRALDETTAESALHTPNAYRQHFTPLISPNLVLLPYATLCLTPLAPS